MVPKAPGVVGSTLEWVEQRQVERRRWVTAAKMARGVERTAGFGKFEEEPRQLKIHGMLTWDGAVSDWEARRSRWAVALAVRFVLPLCAGFRTFLGMVFSVVARETSPTNTTAQFLF